MKILAICFLLVILGGCATHLTPGGYYKDGKPAPNTVRTEVEVFKF